MADTLTTNLEAERAEAVRVLLAQPLRQVGDDLETFQLIARHRDWLATWFDESCGWNVTVDLAAGTARLAKRRRTPAADRPVTNGRGNDTPFDRRRYQFLCLIAAELVTRSITTTGLLAQAVATRCDFETERQRDRRAFVDALRLLSRWRAIDITSGDVDSFVTEAAANALITANATTLHRLIVSATAPSRVHADDPVAAIAELTGFRDERGAADAGSALSAADRDDQNRRIRQSLARRLLDDPVLHFDDCTDAEVAYLTSGAGRGWLRDRVAAAGLLLEERSEGLLAVDPTASTTDHSFPAAGGTVHQMALLLVDTFVAVDPSTMARVPTGRSTDEIVAAVRQRLDRHPRWAKKYQEPGGEVHLAREALALLAAHGLVRPTDDGRWNARPAICRYRADTEGLL